MREVPASQAETHLPQLLDDVERGETIVITRHGRPIARIVPEAERRKDEVGRAIADLRELGKQTGRAAVEDVLSLIREGRKY
jgi:prevent-host-death family protein